MSETVRVRFAPSPTGNLHIGGARTALFNWLYARAKNGKFLLRIEDTDRERSEERFTKDILESLTWLGLEWDETPVYQSSRFSRYTEVATSLLSTGKAYRCDCTTEALESIRRQCEKDKRPFRYPGTCREKQSINGSHVVRVRVPNSGETTFNDLIRGPITFQNKDLDDWVILRTDGSPTYNFSVVIDDHDLRISHVLRGDDHINNTPKQIQLYLTLEFEIPSFAHLPMIMGADRTKLSKRHGAASTLEYRNLGYLPEALICFLVRMGWSHGDQEIFTIDELKQFFSLDKIGKANAIFSPEKLSWVSGHYMRSTPAPEMLGYLRRYFSSQVSFFGGVDDVRIERGISIIQGKVKNILELIEQLSILFGAEPVYDQSTLKPEEKSQFKEIIGSLAPLLAESDFTLADLEKRVRGEAERRGEKLTPFAKALRYAVTGGKVSPGLFEMLEVQGKERVLSRLGKAIEALS